MFSFMGRNFAYHGRKSKSKYVMHCYLVTHVGSTSTQPIPPILASIDSVSLHEKHSKK